MRKVASYSMVAEAEPDDITAGSEAVTEAVDRWLASKGEISRSDRGGTIKFPDGREADFVFTEITSKVGSITEYELTEPTDTGLFQTVLRIGKTGRELALYSELRVGSSPNVLTPLLFDARCPSVIRSIIGQELEWFVGEVLLSTKPISFLGRRGADALAQVIWHPSRTLPVIVVSEHEGSALTPQLGEKIAADLSGLAVVARIDADASWELTSAKGKEWSCYNGAVRLFWPMGARSEDYRAHPLWTRLSLLKGVYESRDASYRLRKLLRRKVFGSSAFSMREPGFFQNVRQESRKEQYVARKEAATTESDWKALADSYAADNQELALKLEVADKEIQDLQARVANLEIAVQWSPAEPDEVEAAEEIPPATVAEAVDRARDRLSEHLIFGSDVYEGLRTLAEDAGPPEKILRYLDQLAEMAQEMRNGPLGVTVIQWLKDRGINCSGESETVRNSKSCMRQRTWNDGSGRSVFDSHLKPSDGTSPDRCVRIYFEADASAGRVIVGWVGRHPE